MLHNVTYSLNIIHNPFFVCYLNFSQLLTLGPKSYVVLHVQSWQIMENSGEEGHSKQCPDIKDKTIKIMKNSTLLVLVIFWLIGIVGLLAQNHDVLTKMYALQNKIQAVQLEMQSNFSARINRTSRLVNRLARFTPYQSLPLPKNDQDVITATKTNPIKIEKRSDKSSIHFWSKNGTEESIILYPPSNK